VPFLWQVWSQYYELGNDVDATLSWVRDRLEETRLADLIPRIYVLAADGTLEVRGLESDSCSSFHRPSDSHARGVTSILSLDLAGDALEIDHDQVLTNQPLFYASKDTLVISEAANDGWWFWSHREDREWLNVHTFDISTAGQATYLASGRVEGDLHDSFSVDEEGGYLRLATTTRGRGDGSGEEENHVFVLGRQGDHLEIVGHLGDIARGEEIMSARLVGDKGYLVTFRQVDPLFTLDLADPTAPKLVGELKIPGYSSYLHPISNEHVLAVGYAGDEFGITWEQQVSLFDVSDFASPKLATTLPLALEGEWAWSEAIDEHKAFTYWAPRKLLALPQSSSNATWNEEQQAYDHAYLSRLVLIDVDAEAGTLVRRGTVDHSDFYNADPDAYPYGNIDIRRSIFMGDFVYTLSDRAISVNRTDDLTRVDVELLPGASYDDSGWGG
jgi:hypothetical protein